SRSIPMSAVKSVEYGDAPAAAPPAATPVATVRAAAPPAAVARPPVSAPVSAPASAGPAATLAAPAAAPAPPSPGALPAPTPDVAPPPRPTLDDVTTETHVLQSGTEVSVQTHETIDGSTAADGQTFDANVTDNIRDADGKIVIPAGAK